jgi:hypothetical protein
MLQLLQTKPPTVLWTRHSSDQSLVSKVFPAPTPEPSPFIFMFQSHLRYTKGHVESFAKLYRMRRAAFLVCLGVVVCLIQAPQVRGSTVYIILGCACRPVAPRAGHKRVHGQHKPPHQQQTVWGLLTASHTCSKLVWRLILYLTALAWA